MLAATASGAMATVPAPATTLVGSVLYDPVGVIFLDSDTEMEPEEAPPEGTAEGPADTILDPPFVLVTDATITIEASTG